MKKSVKRASSKKNSCGCAWCRCVGYAGSKGISPLIATVLIIGFTIVLAGMIIAWGGDLFKSVQESQGKSSEKALLSASVLPKLDVKAEKMSDGLLVSIDNRNDNPIEAVSVRVKDASGNVVGSYSGVVSVPGFSVKKYGISSASLGSIFNSIASVEVTPVLKDSSGKMFVASGSVEKSAVSGSGSAVSGRDAVLVIAPINVNELGLMSGLVGWWAFDSDAKDYSGNGNDGVVSGALFENGYAKFDGVDDTVIMQNSPSLELEKATTLSAWVKIEGNKNQVYDKIVFRGCYDSNQGICYSLSLSYYTDNGILFGLSTSIENGKWMYSTSAPESNKWYHIVASYDSSTGVSSIYINGVLDRSLTNFFSGTIRKDSGDPRFRIGSGNYAPANDVFKGSIDEVRIYNRALSADEVSALYGKGH